MIITINGKACSCERGEFLLAVAKRNGIFIPTLCYHEGLGALGACRVCIVEVVEGGRSRVVTSCNYPVEKEIEVLTASDKIQEQRGVILTLLARLAPDAKVIQQMASFSGADIPRLSNKDGGSTCILCGRCTTACELVGSGAIARINRGTTKTINTPYDEPSQECLGCVSCAHVCPTNSIPYTETETSVSIWGRTFDVLRCVQCGRPISTDELIAQARLGLGEAGTSGEAGVHETLTATADGAPLCTACRQKAVAAKVLQGNKMPAPSE